MGPKGKERMAGAALIALAAGSLWLGVGKAGEHAYPYAYLALLWGLSGMAAFAGADAMAGSRISRWLFGGLERRRQRKEEIRWAAKRLGRGMQEALEASDREKAEKLWRAARPEAVGRLLEEREFWPAAGIASALSGDEAMIRKLGALGWKGEGTDGAGFGAGRCASRMGRPAALRLLLEMGWDPNSKCESGDGEGLRIVADVGWHRNSESARQDGAGHQVALGAGWSHGARSEAYEECLRMLIDAGLDANGRNGDGETAGHLAAAFGEDGLLRILRKGGWDPWVADGKRGWLAGHYAASAGKESTIRLLMEMGWDPASPRNGWIASVVARERGHDGCAEMLESVERSSSERRELEGLVAVSETGSGGGRRILGI